MAGGQAGGGAAQVGPATLDAMVAAVHGGAADADGGMPLPGWLKDRKYLNPLLLAYDERLAQLSGELEGKEGRLDKLAKQVEEVVAENDRLRVEMQQASDRHAAQLEVAAEMEERRRSAVGRAAAQELLQEEVELLRQENELLVRQQQEVDVELQRLHVALEENSREAIRAAQENAALLARMQQANATNHDLETKCSRLAASLKSAEQSAAALAEQVQEAHAAADDERVAAAAARRALEDLQRQHALVQADMAGMQQRTRSAMDAQSSLQVEMSSLRDRHEAAATEAASAGREVEALRSALNSLEVKVLDYQRKDAEVYSRIKEAMEVAEEARLARDGVLARQRELERENEALQQRLSSVRQLVRDQVYSELQGQLHSTAAQLQQAQEELAEAQQQLAEARSTNDRQSREVRGLASELSALKEDLGESISSKSRITLMSLSAMEKIQELERERDEASQKLESTTRRLERMTRDWQLEKQALESEVRDMKRRCGEMETGVTSSRTEAQGLARQLDALVKELQGARHAHVRMESDLRQQVGAIRAERDQEVKALASKLESTLASCNRSVSEAERMIEAKDALLARWKEEAQQIASKLERALGDHKRELEERQAEVAGLRGQLEAMQAENLSLAAEVAEVRGSAGGLHGALEEADARATSLHMALLAAQAREEELQQEVRSLGMMLERAKFSSERSAARPAAVDRSRDALSLKYDAVKRSMAPPGTAARSGR